MNLKEGLGAALRVIRKHKRLSQEDFSDVSGRTYMSTLERGIYSPTVDKLDELASVMGVHPVTLLVASYLKAEPGLSSEELLSRVQAELQEMGLAGAGVGSAL